MKRTADLARAAIKRSIRLGITRSAALFSIIQEQPCEPDVDLVQLYRCVLDILPGFEPNKINVHYTPRTKRSRKWMKKRLARLEAKSTEADTGLIRLCRLSDLC